MENELLNEVTDVTEVEVYDMEPEVSGGNLGKVALGLGIVAAAGVAVAYKFKDKITEHKIKQLEKKGFIVTRPEPEVADNVVEFEGDIVADEE